MKKLFLVLMILCVFCLAAVSCGSDKTTAQTTSACGYTTVGADDTQAPETTTAKITVPDSTPVSTIAPDVSQAPETTKTPDTTKTPVSTAPWEDLIPIL